MGMSLPRYWVSSGVDDYNYGERKAIEGSEVGSPEAWPAFVHGPVRAVKEGLPGTETAHILQVPE
jgi:hypothetical protein